MFWRKAISVFSFLIFLTPNIYADVKVLSIKPNKANFQKIENLYDDVKVECYPENTEWQLLKSFDNTPMLVFSFDKGTHIFTIASNKDKKTYLQQIIVNIDTPEPDKNPDTPVKPVNPVKSPLLEAFSQDKGTFAQAQALSTLLSKVSTATTRSQFAAILKSEGSTINLPATKTVIANAIKTQFPADGPTAGPFATMINNFATELNTIKSMSTFTSTPSTETTHIDGYNFNPAPGPKLRCINGKCYIVNE